MLSSIPFRIKVRPITAQAIGQYNQTSFHRHELVFAKKPIQLLFDDDAKVPLNMYHIAVLPSSVARRLELPKAKNNQPAGDYGFFVSISDNFLKSISESFIDTPETLSLFNEPHILHYSFKTWRHLLHIVDKLDYRLNEEPTDISRKISFALASQLFLEIYELLKIPNAEKLKVDEREQLAFQIKTYVEAHYSEDITITEIADLFQVSTSTINRFFHDYFESTLYRFILFLRLQAAHDYIEQGYSVTESWQKAGFNDYSNFYRAFMKHFHYRPHETVKK